MIESPPSAPVEPPNPAKLSRLGRLAAIVSAGVLAGVIAASAGGMASAQAVVELDEAAPVQAAKVAFAQVQDESDPEVDDDTTVELLEQCLEERASELGDLEAQDALDGAAIEAAFEECGSLLDDFSFDFGNDDGHFSLDFDFGNDPFVEFDFGNDPFVEFDFGDDPHLDFDFDDGNFSFDFGDGFAFDVDLGLSAEDSAVFEEYEGCLDEAGITFDGWFDDLEDLDETDVDDIENAFEECDPILDDLSDEVHVLFEDCPEDAEDADGEDADDEDAHDEDADGEDADADEEGE